MAAASSNPEPASDDKQGRTGEGAALDWLLNWVAGHDSRVPAVYFQICDGEITDEEADSRV